MDADFLKNIITNMKDIKENNPDDIFLKDELRWNFIQYQLKAIKKHCDNFEEYLKNNVKLEELYHPEVLKSIIQDNISKYIENGEDLKNKLMSISVFIDSNLERNVEIIFKDCPELANLEPLSSEYDINSDPLPPLNDFIKDQITEMVKVSLYGTPQEKIEEIIENMIEEYKEEPYTIEYLEGYLTGWMDRDCDD